MSGSWADSNLSDADEQRSQRILQEYGDSWTETGLQQLEKRIRQFLPERTDTIFRRVITDLVVFEFVQRWKSGTKLQVTLLLKAIGSLSSEAELVPLLLAEEYRVRHRLGESVDTEEYRERFPEHFGRFVELIESPSAGTMTPYNSPPAKPQRAANAPEVGNGYEPIKLVGKGSYGEVWAAEAPGGVSVALKVISTPFGHKLSQTELQALELVKQLRHPFILQVQAFWVHNDRLVIAMELADRSLLELHEHHCRHGDAQIPPKDLLRYTRETAEALDYLHQQQRVHRDIKPANILVVSGHAKLADLGLARILENERMDITATLGGTALYMAPEMWHNRVGPRSDQYSLAVTYAELRLGKPLFDGQSQVEVMNQHLKQNPNLAKLEPDERAVLIKALAKKPEHRYESCSAFAAALTAAVLPDAQPENGQSHRRSFIAAATVVLVAGIAALAFMFAPHGEHEELSLHGATNVSVRAGDSKPVFVHLEHYHPDDEATVTQQHASDYSLLSVEAADWNAPEGDHEVTISADLQAAPGEYKVVLEVGIGEHRLVHPLLVKIEKAIVCCPIGCVPGEAATMTKADGRVYWSEVTVEPQKSKFILIPGDGKTPTFYIMENKVTNRLFGQFAESELGASVNPGWRDGVLIETVNGEGTATTKKYQTAKEYPEHPVVRVAVDDAFHFARWLHKKGHLPLKVQWDLASGRYDAEGLGLAGPYRASWKPADRDAIAIGREEFGLANVGTSVADISPSGCRDMAGNGFELTSSLSAQGKRVPSDDGGFLGVVYRGQSFRADRPMRFTDYEDIEDLCIQYRDPPRDDIGFRCVIELDDPSILDCKADW